MQTPDIRTSQNNSLRVASLIYPFLAMSHEYFHQLKLTFRNILLAVSTSLATTQNATQSLSNMIPRRRDASSRSRIVHYWNVCIPSQCNVGDYSPCLAMPGWIFESIC